MGEFKSPRGRSLIFFNGSIQGDPRACNHRDSQDPGSCRIRQVVSEAGLCGSERCWWRGEVGLPRVSEQQWLNLMAVACEECEERMELRTATCARKCSLAPG